MAHELAKLKDALIEGIQLSQQGSYQRRAPAKASVPYFEKARDGLRQFVLTHPDSSEGWKLLSQVEECLLNFGQAVDCLQRSIALTKKPDKRSLKRLALLKQSMAEWSSLPLDPDELEALGRYLIENGASDETRGRSLDITRRWLEENGFRDIDRILQRLSAHGGYTDFQMLFNVVRG